MLYFIFIFLVKQKKNWKKNKNQKKIKRGKTELAEMK